MGFSSSFQRATLDYLRGPPSRLASESTLNRGAVHAEEIDQPSIRRVFGNGKLVRIVTTALLAAIVS
jgi:hypothetical protein